MKSIQNRKTHKQFSPLKITTHHIPFSDTKIVSNKMPANPKSSVTKVQNIAEMMNAAKKEGEPRVEMITIFEMIQLTAPEEFLRVNTRRSNAANWCLTIEATTGSPVKAPCGRTASELINELLSDLRKWQTGEEAIECLKEIVDLKDKQDDLNKEEIAELKEKVKMKDEISKKRDQILQAREIQNKQNQSLITLLKDRHELMLEHQQRRERSAEEVAEMMKRNSKAHEQAIEMAEKSTKTMKKLVEFASGLEDEAIKQNMYEIMRKFNDFVVRA